MWLPVEVTDLVTPSLKHEANLRTSGSAGGSVGPGKLFVLLDGKTGRRKLLSGGGDRRSGHRRPFHALFQIGQIASRMLAWDRVRHGWIGRSRECKRPAAAAPRAR